MVEGQFKANEDMNSVLRAPVAAKMWERMLFLLAVFTPILGETTDIFDVTTVFEAGNPNGVQRIHLRTNALGLPLFGKTDSIVPHDTSESLNTTCDSFENVCHWKIKDCPWKYDSQNVVEGQHHHLKNGIRFNLVNGGNDYLYFTSEKDIFSAYFHVIKFYKENYYSRNSRDDYLLFGRNCKTSESKYSYDSNFIIKNRDRTYYVKCRHSETLSQVDVSNISFYFDQYIQINTTTSSWGGKSSNWVNEINVKYYYADSQSSSPLNLKELAPVYSCESTDSEMISSELYSSSTQLCLVVILKSPTNSAEAVLDILAEDSKKNRFLLQTINNTKVGWNIVHLNLIVPESVTGAVNIVIKKTTSRTILISRISSCNPDGEEVKFIQTPSHLQMYRYTRQFSSSLITTTAFVIEPVDEEISSNTTSCLNGGVMTAAGCACPPGFIGSKCQQGCGRNRFGQDCGGLCSLRKSECEGLVLCTNPTGCHCASGYQGELCITKCPRGQFGNDCSQKCGHCDSCDIYTGECNACEPGYLPPLCKFESVYYPSEPLLTSPEYGTIKVSFNPNKYVGTSGTPELYQIQYKKKSEDQWSWKTYINKIIEKHSDGSVKDMLVSENIEGLKDGVAYQVRVLFLDENFYKYDGDLVRPEEKITKCEIPEIIDYKVKVESYTDSLIFSWSYDNTTQHWCPVENYEVRWKENWQWFTNQTYTNSVKLTDLLPGAKIGFKVRANTSTGLSPYSDVLTASTITTGSSGVRNLKVDLIQSSSVQVSWDPPTGNQDKKLQYCISYKCVDQLACSPGCQNVSEGQITTEDTHVTLKPLVPFTRYMVTVTPHNGPASSIYVGTSKDVPKEVPRPSNHSSLRTNTSLTVSWGQPVVCSGFLLGYNYQLVKELEILKVLNSGFTKDTSVSFHNLTASTQYTVRVFVVTIAGWDPESYLAINISTSATVPEAVRNLTIYKRSKGMLGLRWAPPRAVYGELKSFTIKYTLGQDEISRTVEPTPCIVWPELFCHTVEGLRPNRRYNLTISARNTELPEEGEIAFVTGVTKENPPTAPQNLKVVNSTSTSIALQWKYPEMANGIVRSFLISVEETENYDQENCCQIYPLVETFVKEEAQIYETEVSGLHPASSYFVSVSAKTVGMGPSQSLVAYTRPPHLPLTSLPKVEAPASEELTWLPQQTLPDVNNSEIYTPLIKAHLLLAVINESRPFEGADDSGIIDPQLNSLLETDIEKPFFFIAEYNQEDVVTVVGTLQSTDSVWGNPPASLRPLLKYQLIAVQISEYSGIFSVDLRLTQPFTLLLV